MKDKKRLLLVDDDTAILRSMSSLFFKRGFDVFCAESFQEALHTLKKEQIHLIISDLKMPKKSCMDLLV